jgi:membrane protease YdiL (CAAX protease family)
MRATATPLTAPDIRRPARLGLAIYFAIVLALSIPIEGFLIANPDKTGAIALLMFVPIVASVVARLALREGFSDVSFRFGGLRGLGAIGIALVFPVAVGIVAYVPAWVTGLAGFDARLSAGMLVPFAVGSIIGLVLAAGEEIGWRGYMLTRLIDAGVPRPVFASGLIWGLWHVPLVLGGVVRCGAIPRDLGRAHHGHGHLVRVRFRAPAPRDRQHLAGGRAARGVEPHNPAALRPRHERGRGHAVGGRVGRHYRPYPGPRGLHLLARELDDPPRAPQAREGSRPA